MSESPNGSISTVLVRLHDAVFGYNGHKGLIQDVDMNRRRIESLEEFRRDVHSLKEWARWLALSIAATIGFLLSETAGAYMARVGRLLAAISSSSVP